MVPIPASSSTEWKQQACHQAPDHFHEAWILQKAEFVGRNSSWTATPKDVAEDAPREGPPVLARGSVALAKERTTRLASQLSGQKSTQKEVGTESAGSQTSFFLDAPCAAPANTKPQPGKQHRPRNWSRWGEPRPSPSRCRAALWRSQRHRVANFENQKKHHEHLRHQPRQCSETMEDT